MFNWAGNRFFNYIHGQHLVYGSCWEDPRVDREALQIRHDDRMLVITSAGCNVLDYLLEMPAEIHAVDLNYRQNALLDLKLKGIAQLQWSDFFQLFGRGHHPLARDIYDQHLRQHLQPEHRRFWDRHIEFFSGRRPFYDRTTSGYFAAWFRWYIARVVRLEEPIQALLEAKSIDEQREIYDRQIRNRFWQASLGRCLRRDAVLALSGIPPDQRRQIASSYPDMLAYLQQKAEQIIYHLPLKENHFWRVYLTGQYTQQCCPRYLEETNFIELKTLIERVTISTASVREHLERSQQSFSKFVLLDHMDWLSHGRYRELEGEWQAIVSKACIGAVVLWRSLGLQTDFVDRAQVSIQGTCRSVGEFLSYDHELAQRLQSEERVNAYGCLKIAKFKYLHGATS